MGNNIKELRHQRLLKQSDLVERCNIPGFDVPMLSKIENGKIMPTPEIEKALMLHLQAAKDELYGEWKEIPVKHTNREHIEEPPMEVVELVSYLKPGKQNAISRWQLRQKMDVTDRVLRRIIARASEYGYAIGNLSDGKGYFLCETQEEAKAYIAQETSRAWEIMNKLNPFYKLIEGD